MLLSATHEDASRYGGTGFVFRVRWVRVDGDDGYRVPRPPVDATRMTRGV